MAQTKRVQILDENGNTTTITIPALWAASDVAPVATDDENDGFAVGSLWLQITAGPTFALFVCSDPTATAAVWTAIPAGSQILPTLWDAQSYVKAIVDDTPVVQTVLAGELLGRPLGGDIGVIGANGFTLAFLANLLAPGSFDCTNADIFAAFLAGSMDAAFLNSKVAAGAIARSKLAITAKAALPDDSTVVPAADFVKGVLTAAVIDAGGRTKTTPTATDIVAALPGAGVGTQFQVVIINKGAGTITLAMDASVTNLGHAGDLTLVSGATATYNVLITAAATADFYKIR